MHAEAKCPLGSIELNALRRPKNAARGGKTGVCHNPFDWRAVLDLSAIQQNNGDELQTSALESWRVDETCSIPSATLVTRRTLNGFPVTVPGLVLANVATAKITTAKTKAIGAESGLKCGTGKTRKT